LFLVLAAMVSAFAGCGAAIALQLRRPASTGLTNVADAIGIRPLVEIPRFKNESRAEGVVQIQDPRLYIESIRFLRDTILEHDSNRHTTACLVTSILPRQGKSLVAMSLARALARAGRRTLFMEVDLRQPMGSRIARQDPLTTGIGAVLEGRASIDKVIVQDAASGLDMLLAETDARNSVDYLTPSVLRRLLAKLRARYEVIIIDSPPVGIVSDALTLTAVVDKTILVAKEGDSSIAELKRGTRLLKDRGATMAGLVLTSVDPEGMCSVDKKTLRRYVIGVPGPTPIRKQRVSAAQ
jgi:capsular exopolysaccharide synthesis family protein